MFKVATFVGRVYLFLYIASSSLSFLVALFFQTCIWNVPTITQLECSNIIFTILLVQQWQTVARTISILNKKRIVLELTPAIQLAITAEEWTNDCCYYLKFEIEKKINGNGKEPFVHSFWHNGRVTANAIVRMDDNNQAYNNLNHTANIPSNTKLPSRTYATNGKMQTPRIHIFVFFIQWLNVGYY